MESLRRTITGMPVQIFMTMLWISVGWGPIANDFNATHLFNPDWPPHARFHMMMVFSDAVALALFGLYLCWGPTVSRPERLRLSALLHNTRKDGLSGADNSSAMAPKPANFQQNSRIVRR